jgi:hypothetical protein
MASNGKHKAWKKHAQRNHHSPCKPVANRLIHQVRALKPNKRRKDDQGCRQDIADGDPVDKQALRQPRAEQHGLDLHKRDGGIGAAKRERARYQPQNEQVDERRRAGDAEGEGHGRWYAAKDDVDGVADVLQDE